MGENSGVISDSDEEEFLDADTTFAGSRGNNNIDDSTEKTAA